MLDYDLAEMYEVETRVLNQAVKRKCKTKKIERLKEAVVMLMLKDTSNKRSGSFDDFGISTQVFFSDRAKVQWTFEPACVKAQKRSLTELIEYFGNAVSGKKTPELVSGS